jgi:hypothetical protein
MTLPLYFDKRQACHTLTAKGNNPLWLCPNVICPGVNGQPYYCAKPKPIKCLACGTPLKQAVLEDNEPTTARKDRVVKQ